MRKISRINLFVILIFFIHLFGTTPSIQLHTQQSPGVRTGDSLAICASDVSVTIVSPVVGESYSGDVNISWIISDTDVNETYASEILLSADSGETFQLLAENITSMSYIWDSSGYLMKDTYAVMVRAYDSSGINSTGVSPIFSAGDINSGGGPRWPTSSTTNSDIANLQFLVDGLLEGMMIGCFCVITLGTIFIAETIRKKQSLQAE